MKSIYAYTEEIDDLELAVQELKQQIEEKGPLFENSCAIVNCDYDTDVEKLVRLLKECFDFPILGCTAISVLNKEQGHTDMCISMIVMTADDCFFQIGMTEEMHTAADLFQVDDCFIKLHNALPKREKVILLYAPLWEEIVADDVNDRLSAISGGDVPIYGGVASDNWSFHKGMVFCDGKVSYCGAVMLLISGNVRPITMVEHSMGAMTDFKCTVTMSEGKKVFSLNNNDIINVLRSAGLESNKEVVVTTFCSTPFLCTRATADGDEIDLLKMLYKLNYDEHSGTFLGNVQAGNKLSMGFMSREDVEISVQIAIEKVLDSIWDEENKGDYKYSTMFCTSCAARYNIIVADKQIEARSYQGKVPEHINVFGYYSYGEYCPVQGKVYGKKYNETHNETFAILAF